ncbi:hypothetical protein J4476_00210 [Candidatus Woesearchaeota archaeon]|nr:hypothetical protein [Candidatus Woesearchaeota archaeon]HIH25517.1 hypothetical protein [Nanoarchaeota archaeon]
MSENPDDILNKYRKKINDHVDKDTLGQVSDSSDASFSNEYSKFRDEITSSKRSSYEQWCNFAERVIKFSPSPKILSSLETAIDTAHLNITPVGASSFAALSGLIIILSGFLLSLIIFALQGMDFANFPIFTLLVFLITGLLSFVYLPRIPIYIATRWRLQASNQMVTCILYVVIYMRHTSNLEHAIKFAAQHIDAPLSLDLRKIFWDMETRKFSTIKESLDNYLESWRHYNLEFVTSFHLIESSLYEPSDSRRLDLLDKSLSVILEGTYEKMLHYAQEIKSPITTLHMLGVILPILGLVIFPLLGAFLQGLVKWYHLAFIYNIVLPLMVYIFGMNILSRRPTGYGNSKIINSVYERGFNPFWLCFMIASFFIIIGLFPLVINILNPPSAVDGSACLSNDIDLGKLGCFFGFINFQNSVYGPFGIGALFLSFFVPAGLAFSLAYYYKLRSNKIIELRNETKDLETEFSSALFQLGNRIGDGIPTEMAFSSVSKTLEGTPSGNFFKAVDTNIRQLGMGINEALFNPKNGAILSYPSPLIESSMEVLLESSRKGPSIVSQSLISISTYIERIHKVSERLKDLLAEVISSMKAQISFLTPAIAGIVVGISAMVVNIIVKLNMSLSVTSFEGGSADVAGSAGGLTALVDLFSVNGIIPSYWFQLVVGIYVVELAFVLTILQNGIENGSDKINEQYLLGKNLGKSFLLYAIIAFIVTLLFTFMAQGILQGELV